MAAAMKALASSDLDGLKAALAAAERHLNEYGDVATLILLLKHEISKIEEYRD
jgi:hypothetical protein